MQTGSANPKEFLQSLFYRAIQVADPLELIPQQLPDLDDKKNFVVGAGKASARMAEALEQHLGACWGLVVVPYGHARPCQGIEIVEASHPVPDQAGVAASLRILQLVDGLGTEDRLICLISGGASALLCAPADGLSLAEKQAITSQLLASGAPISEINALRKSLSKIKGGRLAQRANPAEVMSLLISDVPGDNPGIIGSGPTVVSNYQQDVLGLRKKWLPTMGYLDEILLNNPAPTSLQNATNTIIATPAQSLAAAAKVAQAAGLKVIILGDAIEGEARVVAAEHARLALASPPNRLLLSGGELTVSKKGNGIGGPNAEYALALALALDGKQSVYALAGDTDGIDGAAQVAASFVDPTTLERGGLEEAKLALQNNDAHSFFARLNDQIITGPTHTNVNDFRAILVAG